MRRTIHRCIPVLATDVKCLMSVILKVKEELRTMSTSVGGVHAWFESGCLATYDT